ncbi:Conserved hypothetical protein CHP02391 [Methanobacterium lacus]|uniref:Conserved hypothetical protein CHP02391 domain-containing protein n=1 Tax=Methanobacterium lacus (strain AL-21) TaxID=877455 RepID=F0T8U4_METLA|nr:TIGR02391 family protein [Methanobacterium lacus]ADZ09772.1 Conserved hypothetical protein CHP02391 [Methanobacterium lacus]
MFYQLLIDFLENFFGGGFILFDKESNRIYLRLYNKINEIIGGNCFEENLVAVDFPFIHLRSLDPDAPETDWIYGGQQLCGEQLSSIEDLFIKTGENVYELDEEDSNLISSINDYMEDISNYKKEENLRLLKIAKERTKHANTLSNSKKIMEENNIIDFWDLIHENIVKVSKSRFNNEHYADAVESAFKEVNIRVKRIVENKIGQELDGKHLMDTAFSFSNTSNPTIILDDLSKKTGKNIQRGYKQLFSGSMQAIRNPKAHENIEINKNEAIHFIFLASSLMFKLDNAIEINED